MSSCSLPHLTRLEFECIDFDGPIWEEIEFCKVPHGLKELYLSNIDMHWQWFETAFKPLKRLEVLEIDCCSVRKKQSSQLHPVSSLR